MVKKILIADDQRAVRCGIREMLTAEYSAVDIGEVAHSDDIFPKLYEEAWDLLILDIDLPGRGGLDVLRRMSAEGIRVPVVVLSFHKEARIAEAAVQCGAFRYVTKDNADSELIPALNDALFG